MMKDELMKDVLIIEDDARIREILNNFLTGEGFLITEAGDGYKAVSLLAQKRFDIILLDMMLPGRLGGDIIDALRKETENINSQTPVIVISAKNEIETRLEALRAGADDYIVKPFDFNEVLARIEAVLRRSGRSYIIGTRGAQGRFPAVAGFVFDTDTNEVTFEGTPVKLTAKERKLLLLFLENPKKTFTKANLYESVWEEDYIYEDNTINVHISNLRKKLKDAAGREIIETVWGIGYRLVI